MAKGGSTSKPRELLPRHTFAPFVCVPFAARVVWTAPETSPRPGREDKRRKERIVLAAPGRCAPGGCVSRARDHYKWQVNGMGRFFQGKSACKTPESHFALGVGKKRREGHE